MCRLVPVHCEIVLLVADRQRRFERSSFSLAFILTSASLHHTRDLTDDARRNVHSAPYVLTLVSRTRRKYISIKRQFFGRVTNCAYPISLRRTIVDVRCTSQLSCTTSQRCKYKSMEKESGTNEPRITLNCRLMNGGPGKESTAR